MSLHLGEFKHYSYYLKYVIQFAANCRHLLAPYFTGSNYCWELFTHSLCRSQGGTCVNVKLSQALTPLNCLKTFTPTEKSRLQIKLAITTIFLMHAGIWHRLREAVRHKWHQAADDLARGSPTHCSEHWHNPPDTAEPSRQGTRGVLSFIIWEQRPQDFLFLLSTPSPEKLWVPT